MVVSLSRFGRKVLGVGLGLSVGVTLLGAPAFAQTDSGAPLDPYGPPQAAPAPATPPTLAPGEPIRIPAPKAPPAQATPPAPAPPPVVAAPAPPPIVAAPAPPPPVHGGGQSGGITITNTPVITASPTNTANPINTNTVTANPTNTNTNTNTANQHNTSTNNNTNDNKNDNRSNAAATATNSNTIYIYPPQYTPPAPPTPIAAAPSILPPPLVPPPMLPPYSPQSPYYRPQRIRLNCARLCAPPPVPISPVISRPLERVRFVSLGGHFTMMGLAHQPLAGWGTIYGGGISLQFRSRGRFGFEMSQDFLHGDFKSGDAKFDRKSYPFEFTFKGYIMPNSDRNHFNMYFGGGLGAMASTVGVPLGGDVRSNQDFLEWMIHGDLGAELRFKWLALGVEGRIDGLVRDRSYGAGAQYGNIQNAPVPASTWGVEGRAHLDFWF